MRNTLLAIGIVLLAIGIERSATAMTPWGGTRAVEITTQVTPQQGIQLISLNGTSFPAGSGIGTTVGTVSVGMVPPTPAFSGTLSTSNANFTMSGTTLQVNVSNLCPAGGCSYSVPITATESGTANSPVTNTFTVVTTGGGGGGGAWNHKGTQDNNLPEEASPTTTLNTWQSIGVGWARVFDGAWQFGCVANVNFPSKYSSFLSAASARGINILWMLNSPGGNGCAGGSLGGKGDAQAPPANIPLYVTDFVTPMVQSIAGLTTPAQGPYPAGTHFYELWNEPLASWGRWIGGGGTVASFATWAQDAYTAIHANDAHAVVLIDGGTIQWPPWGFSGALSVGGNPATSDTLLLISQAGLLTACGGNPCFDEISIHPYPRCGPSGWGSNGLTCSKIWTSIYSNGSGTGRQSLVSEMTSYGIGNMRIWATEIGCQTGGASFDTPNNCNCAQQANLYTEMLADPATRYPTEGPIMTFAWVGTNKDDNYDINPGSRNGSCPATYSVFSSASGVW